MLKSQNLVCPELLAQSDDVEIILEKLEQPVTHGKLSLFETRWLSNNAGGIVFVGGPVASMEFHPYAKGICAIGAHRADQQTHEILRCYQGLAHIQLWCLSSEFSQCSALISHEGNCTWDLKWRPEESLNTDDMPWSGTLAAALGDGTVMVYSIGSAELDTPTHTGGDVAVLSPQKIHLRANRRFSARSPVRVVEWSKDGNLLVVGAADGSIEVYNAHSADSTWPKWSIPGHESVIVDMRWLSSFHLCSLGLSCVLRLRDIREPVALLEQNMEGLSGSMSMEALEPNVAVIGGDYGYLRVVRLSGADGVMTRLPVRRMRLQTGSFRAMKSIPVAGYKSSSSCQTLLYTAGAEGLLHECRIPRPLWTSPEVCHIGRTKICERLRWVAKRTGEGGQAEFNSARITLSLHLSRGIAASALQTEATKPETEALGSELVSTASGESLAKLAGTEDTLDVDNNGNVEANKSAKKKITRKSKAVGKDLKGLDYSFFGESYNQKIVISRISISEKSDMIAVGIDGGMVTWLKLNLKVYDAAAREEEACKQRKRMEKRTPQSRTGPKEDKVIKPPRKRGRPRKYPLTPDKAVPSATTNADEAEFVDGDKQDTANGVADAQKARGMEKEKEKEKEKEARPKATPMIGPKRKRGRPRKNPPSSVETSAQGPLVKKRKTRETVDDSLNDGTALLELEPKGDGTGQAKRAQMASTVAATAAVLATAGKSAEAEQARSKDAHVNVEAEASVTSARADSAKTGSAKTAVALVETTVDADQAMGEVARIDGSPRIARVIVVDNEIKRGGKAGEMPATDERQRGAGHKRKSGTITEGRGGKRRRGEASGDAGIAVERVKDIRKGIAGESRIGDKAPELRTRGAVAAYAAFRSDKMEADGMTSGREHVEMMAWRGRRREEEAGTEAVARTEQLKDGRDRGLRSGAETSLGDGEGLRGVESGHDSVPCRLRRKAGATLKLRVRAPREQEVGRAEVKIGAGKGGEKKDTIEGYREGEKSVKLGKRAVNVNEENENGGEGGKKVKVKLRLREGRDDEQNGGKRADGVKKTKTSGRVTLRLRVRTGKKEEDGRGVRETREELRTVERNEETETIGRSRRKRKPSWKVALADK